ncbi:MAG: hypothetical protein ACRD8A_10315 [Candidatus Acidiferrales bacterium]
MVYLVLALFTKVKSSQGYMATPEYIHTLEPGLFLALLIVPAGLWILFRPSRWRGMHLRGDRIVFPTTTLWQVAGVFVAYVCTGFVVISVRQRPGVQWKVILIAVVFAFAGISVLFREIRVDRQCFEKKFLWMSEKIDWAEATDLSRTKHRAWVISGGLKRISVSRYYADFELLILDIVKRMNSSQDTSANPPTSAVVQ